MDWLNRLMGDLTGYDEPQDFADIFISGNITDESEVSSYVRDLDLRTGLASVSYNWKGVHYTREYFNSYPDNVLAVHLSADQKGCLSFSVCLKDCTHGTSLLNHTEADTIILKNTLKSNGMKTEAQLKVIPEGGEMTAETDSIRVSHADSVTLIFACGTDYKMELPAFRGEDPHEAISQRIQRAAAKGYSSLRI